MAKNSFDLERAVACLGEALTNLSPPGAPAGPGAEFEEAEIIARASSDPDTLRVRLAAAIRARLHLRTCIRAIFNGALRRALELEAEVASIDRLQGGRSPEPAPHAKFEAVEASHRPIPREWRRESLDEERKDPSCPGCAMSEAILQLTTALAFAEVRDGHLDELLREAWKAQKAAEDLRRAFQKYTGPHIAAVLERRKVDEALGWKHPDFRVPQPDDPPPPALATALEALDTLQLSLSLWYPASAWLPRQGQGTPALGFKNGAVLCLRASHMGPAAIARALGISLQAVKDVLREWKGVKPPEPQRRRALRHLLGGG